MQSVTMLAVTLIISNVKPISCCWIAIIYFTHKLCDKNRESANLLIRLFFRPSNIAEAATSIFKKLGYQWLESNPQFVTKEFLIVLRSRNDPYKQWGNFHVFTQCQHAPLQNAPLDLDSKAILLLFCLSHSVRDSMSHFSTIPGITSPLNTYIRLIERIFYPLALPVLSFNVILSRSQSVTPDLDPLRNPATIQTPKISFHLKVQNPEKYSKSGKTLLYLANIF